MKDNVHRPTCIRTWFWYQKKMFKLLTARTALITRVTVIPTTAERVSSWNHVATRVVTKRRRNSFRIFCFCQDSVFVFKEYLFNNTHDFSFETLLFYNSGPYIKIHDTHRTRQLFSVLLLDRRSPYLLGSSQWGSGRGKTDTAKGMSSCARTSWLLCLM